jgi:HEAT repeat protein
MTRGRSKHLRMWRWAGPVIAALALQPAAGVLWKAHEAGAQDEEDESPQQARKRVLAAIPRDPAVLINVTGREMPSSPDILNLGKRGTRALERCLSDNVDADIRRTCAILLGRLGDRRALPTLQTALADWEAPVRNQVVQALRLIPDRSSYEPLVKLYERKDEEPSNRAAILAALGSLGDPRALPLLRSELRRKPAPDQPDLRPDAFAALWASRHLMAPSTLVADVITALRSDNKALVTSATVSAAELRSPQLVPALIPLLEVPDSPIRNKAVYALGRIGDKTATQALLARLPHVREARMLNNIAFALERLDSRAFYPAIQQLIEHKQAVIRMNAAFVVGDVHRPEGLPLLRKALEDPSDYVKTSAVVALGKLDDPAAIPLLEPFVANPNLSIRQEAIYAIYELSGRKRSDLVFGNLFQSRNNVVQRRAAIELAKAGDPRVHDYLLQCLEWNQCALRDVDAYLRGTKDPATSGRLLLAWTRGRWDLTDLISALRPPGTLPLAASTIDASLARGQRDEAEMAIDLVGDLGDAAVKDRLDRALADTDSWLRLHAAVAASRLGDASADARIFQELDNFPADWLPMLARVLARVQEAPARARLMPELARRERGQDVDVALATAAVHLAWDPDNAIFRMLDGLASQSVRERDLAAQYLRKNRSERVTWLLRRALARETRPTPRDMLRKILDVRSES